MRRNDSHAALQREPQQLRIGKRGIDYRHGVFTAGMSEKR